jgi:predicted phage baseplate assembly protein
MLKANQLSQLMTRPLGVKAAVNPLPAKGADDAEKLEEARRNAPLTLLTLGRIVSLQDYEDYARSFPGVEKALATWTWKNQRRYIFLTVAGVNGATLLKSDNLYKNLLQAIADSGDARVNVVVDSYKPRYFRIVANVKVDPDYITEKVLKEVEQRLRTAFSFDARSFGQPVSLSEVVAVFQQVKGVVAVDVDQLYFAGEAKASGPSPLLKASIPLMNAGYIQPAELLTLDNAPVDLRIMP